MKRMCHVSPTCLQYPLIKWSGKIFYPSERREEEKKKQSIKPSNDKYEIAMWSEYYFPLSKDAGQIIRMKGRSLFVCKWEIDYIYLLAEGLRTARLWDTHTHTHKEEWETSIESLVIRQLFFCLFYVQALMTEERNNTEKTEGEKEKERDQSCGCQHQQGSPLQNILITSPPHYRCHVSERRRKGKKKERERELQAERTNSVIS